MGILAETQPESDTAFCAAFGASRRGVDLLNFVRRSASLSPVRESKRERMLTEACAKALATNPNLSDASRYPSELSMALSNSVCYLNSKNAIEDLVINSKQPRIGLRRWFFHPLLRKISVGSSNGVSCARVIDVPENFDTTHQLVLIPSPGTYPASISGGNWSVAYIGSLSNGEVYVVDEKGSLVETTLSREFELPGMLGMPTLTLSHQSMSQKYYVLIKLPDRAFAYRIRLLKCEGKSYMGTALVALGMLGFSGIGATYTMKKRNQKEKFLSLISPLEFNDIKED